MGPLPDYPYALGDRDPAFRVQYQILLAWQRNRQIKRDMDAYYDSIDAEWMSKTRAQMTPVENASRYNSKQLWKREGLPFAWEYLLKTPLRQQDWKSRAYLIVIQAYPHADSVEPLRLLLSALETHPDFDVPNSEIKSEYLSVARTLNRILDAVDPASE